jgi:hypothetical protein
VFTARYALSPYIKQIRFVFKGLMHIELLWRSQSWSFKIWGVGVGSFVYRLHNPGAICFIYHKYKWRDVKSRKRESGLERVFQRKWYVVSYKCRLQTAFKHVSGTNRPITAKAAVSGTSLTKELPDVLIVQKLQRYSWCLSWCMWQPHVQTWPFILSLYILSCFSCYNFRSLFITHM